MQIEKKYYTVEDKETVNLLIEHIDDCELLAIDTETDSLNPRKGKIIGWSLSGEEGLGFYLPTMEWDPEKEELKELQIEGKSAHEISKKLLSRLKGKKLIAHNASFDIRFIDSFYKIDLLDDLWADTAMLVHTVREEGAGMGVFGLKPLAISVQEHIGLNVEEAANKEQIELKESIRKNGGLVTKDNFEIYKADLPIISKYAAADTDLTLRIYNYFLKILKEEGLEKFFFEEEVMPIYKEVTIPMEKYGVALDMELLHKTYEDIKVDLEKNKEIVIKSLIALPEAKKWVVDTALKTFPVSNKGTWAQAFAKHRKLPLATTGKAGRFSITAKTVAGLEDETARLFLQTGDKEHLEETEMVKVSLNLWKDSNGGDFINVQSKLQLSEIIFDYMGIKSLTTTDSGRKQLDMDMVEHLAKKYEWAENLRVYNKLLKIKSTYIERFIDGAEDGRYYFYYKQNGTVSGRYGSDAQQLPKPKEEGDESSEIVVKYNNIVRAFLIAGKGRKIIDSDYNSLEPCCFSSVTGDEGLQAIFKNGWDFYSTIAIKTEKLDEDKKTYPNGVSPDKKAPNFLKKLDPSKRNKAKAYSLGIPYGMSAFALGKTLGISTKEADVLVNGYLNGFPKLKEWLENSREFVKKNGYIKNYVGRIRHLPEAKFLYERFGDSLLDWNAKKALEPIYGKELVLSMSRDYKNQLNNCLNYQLQSLAATIVNRAAVKINRKAKELGIDAIVQAQVHDQLIINVREDQAEMFAPIVQEIMENNLKIPGVDLVAPPQIADNFRDGH